MENTKPIKRNKNIVPLSREHHAALLFGWKLRWGVHLNIPAERISKYVNWFWINYLKPHQEEEDRLLFFDKNDTLVQKALDDHYIISGTFEDIIANKKQSPDDFLGLADFLEDHTRYEERILFPHLESKLPNEQLENIGKALQEHDRDRSAEEDYEDEFWRKKNK